MTSLIFGDRADAMNVLAVDEKGRMRCVNQLILLRKPLKERNQLLLGGGMEVQTGFVEKQYSVGMPFFRLD